MKRATKTHTVTLRMTPEDNALFDRVAVETGRTKSSLITFAAKAFLSKIPGLAANALLVQKEKQVDDKVSTRIEPNYLNKPLLDSILSIRKSDI